MIQFQQVQKNDEYADLSVLAESSRVKAQKREELLRDRALALKERRSTVRDGLWLIGVGTPTFVASFITAAHMEYSPDLWGTLFGLAMLIGSLGGFSSTLLGLAGFVNDTSLYKAQRLQDSLDELEAKDNL